MGGSLKLGLGLWSSVTATLIVECVLFAVGVAWYARRTRALDAGGKWGFRTLVAFLAVSYVANLVGAPPSATAVGATALLLWLLVPWAYWVDRHRTASE